MVFIYGRQFRLLDCDGFTRTYYRNMLGYEQPPGVRSSNGDSFQCPRTPPPRVCITKPEKLQENTIRKIFNHPKKLRYLMKMIPVHKEDEGREFVLEYSLSNGTMKINELGKKNSGRRAGCFLGAMLVPKTRVKPKNCEEEILLYYTPEDFFIGAKINVFNHRFVITEADLFVLKYVEANQDKFPTEVILNIREFFGQHTREENKNEEVTDNVEKGDQVALLSARGEADSPADAQKIIRSLPGPCMAPPEEHPKQITWADQVQVPCALTDI